MPAAALTAAVGERVLVQGGSGPVAVWAGGQVTAVSGSRAVVCLDDGARPPPSPPRRNAARLDVERLGRRTYGPAHAAGDLARGLLWRCASCGAHSDTRALAAATLARVHGTEVAFWRHSGAALRFARAARGLLRRLTWRTHRARRHCRGGGPRVRPRARRP